MSPEIAGRQSYNGHAADVWALGVSLYLMLHGKFPFRAANEK
jgi:serine/threonine protein kinase